MSGPDYLICLECETPCYVFEWKDGQILEATCEACGNDDTDDFISQEDLDTLTAGRE